METAPVKRDREGKFLPGSKGGPGRPVGSKSKLQQVKADFFEAFQRLGGIEGLVDWVNEDPKHRGDFYRLLVQMLPRDMTLEAIDSRRSVTEYETSELIAYLEHDSANPG
jgi:hypothetical protein